MPCPSVTTMARRDGCIVASAGLCRSPRDACECPLSLCASPLGIPAAAVPLLLLHRLHLHFLHLSTSSSSSFSCFPLLPCYCALVSHLLLVVLLLRCACLCADSTRVDLGCIGVSAWDDGWRRRARRGEERRGEERRGESHSGVRLRGGDENRGERRWLLLSLLTSPRLRVPASRPGKMRGGVAGGRGKRQEGGGREKQAMAEGQYARTRTRQRTKCTLPTQLS